MSACVYIYHCFRGYVIIFIIPETNHSASMGSVCSLISAPRTFRYGHPSRSMAKRQSTGMATPLPHADAIASRNSIAVMRERERREFIVDGDFSRGNVSA